MPNRVAFVTGASRGIGRAIALTLSRANFDIVVASEIMAIFCLATSIKDLKDRLGGS